VAVQAEWDGFLAPTATPFTCNQGDPLMVIIFRNWWKRSGRWQHGYRQRVVIQDEEGALSFDQLGRFTAKQGIETGS